MNIQDWFPLGLTDLIFLESKVIPEWPNAFPYFLQFKTEFCSKELMIWVTASSKSCFWWLYRAFPSLAAKNIINLISVLTTWWCPCIELSLGLLKKSVCIWPASSLNKTLLAFALLHFVQGQTCLLFQVSLDFWLLHFNPLWGKGLCVCVCVLVRRCCRSS